MCDDAKGVLEKGDDNQESSDRWKVSVRRVALAPVKSQVLPDKELLITPWWHRPDVDKHSRLDRVRERVQPVLNLARLLADRVQGARVICCVNPARTAKGVLISQVIPCCSSDLCHFPISTGRFSCGQEAGPVVRVGGGEALYGRGSEDGNVSKVTYVS